MAEQVFWEDVNIGTEIPPLVKNPTTQQLARWAGASGDYYQIHYDKDFALNSGLPGVLVHGPLKSAWLGQFLSGWVAPEGRIKRYGCSHRGMDLPGSLVTCKGTVVRKYVEQDEHCVECEIWIENARGERTAPGSAVLVLPSRASLTG